MKDPSKTKHELIEELSVLKQRLQELEHSESDRKQAEEELLKSEENFRRSLDDSSLGVRISTSGAETIYVNQAMLDIYGYDSVAEMKRMPVKERYAPQSYAEYKIRKEKRERGELDPSQYEISIVRKNGEVRHLQAFRKEILWNGVKQAQIIYQDITGRKQAEAKLRQQTDAMETAIDGMAILNEEGEYVYLNKAHAKVYGYENAGELIGKSWRILYDSDVIQRFEQEIMPEFSRKGDWHGETIGTKKNGKARDITERKQPEEEIQKMAYHDSLTGLPNRNLFSDRLGIALAQAQRNQKTVGVVMLDLDKFKDVNDTLGHDVGDLLLKAATERLNAALRKGDTIARFGGDEFVLILPDLKTIENAIQVVQKIVDSFCKPFLIDTHQLIVTTSIGIAVYPNDGKDEAMLLKNADIAMYQAKEAGRARYQLYEKT